MFGLHWHRWALREMHYEESAAVEQPKMCIIERCITCGATRLAGRTMPTILIISEKHLTDVDKARYRAALKEEEEANEM